MDEKKMKKQIDRAFREERKRLKTPHKEIHAWSRRKGHKRLRWLGREMLHILLTFAVGVSIAMLYHEIITNANFRAGVERVCTLYGRDETECKANIDEALDMSDAEVDNNINIGGEE